MGNNERLRLASIDDMPYLLSMSKEFISVSPYRDYPVDDEKLTRQIQHWLTNPNTVFVLDDGLPVGMIAGVINEFLFNVNTVASEMVWWVNPGVRGGGFRLKRAFEQWAQDVGADYVHMSSTADPRVNKYYERCGYRLTESTYIKEL